MSSSNSGGFALLLTVIALLIFAFFAFMGIEYLFEGDHQMAGFKVGSYHFFTSYKSAQLQFENFKRNVDKNEQDLLPMVDVEEAGNRFAKRQTLQVHLAEFMELVRKEYGQYPLLYSQYKFYNDLLAPEFNKYFIFIARYGSSAPVLRGGGNYNIWQFTERGHIDGIKGTVDLNRFSNGTTLGDILL